MTTKVSLILFFLLTGFGLFPSKKKENTELISYFTTNAIPFSNSSELDRIIEEAGEKKLVLLGEASHGTYEYYLWRAEISKRLISEKKFRFIAVEGDWAAIYRLNQYVKGLDNALPSAEEVLQTFNRWPEWMWANKVILELAEWLRNYNEPLPGEEKAGFYGIDVYGHWDAMNDLLVYTEKHLPEKHYDILTRLDCFARFEPDEWLYARGTALNDNSCSELLQQVEDTLLKYRNPADIFEEKAHFRAEQNALVAKNAEKFYRHVYHNNTSSWNSRVDHMWASITRLIDFHGENTKGIVWAHNTHVGDSRATDMKIAGRYNMGELSRRTFGINNIFILGFSTFSGRVNAASEWEDPMRIMKVPRAKKGSLDYLFAQLPHEQFFLIFNEDDKKHPLLSSPIGHRAIGVTYSTYLDYGNYVPTLPAYRYDAMIFIRETGALVP